MKHKPPMTAAELEQQIIKHPVRMYFKMHIGLLDMINRNGEDMMDALEEIAEAAFEFCICLLAAFRHILIFAFYPVAKMILLMRLRQKIIEHPGLLHLVITDSSTSEK